MGTKEPLMVTAAPISPYDANDDGSGRLGVKGEGTDGWRTYCATHRPHSPRTPLRHRPTPPSHLTTRRPHKELLDVILCRGEIGKMSFVIILDRARLWVLRLASYLHLAPLSTPPRHLTTPLTPCWCAPAKAQRIING